VQVRGRLLRIMASLLACDGEVSGLEHAFGEPNFTAGEREVFAKCLRRALEGIERAETELRSNAVHARHVDQH
jgi:hypothetical protein